MATAAKPKTAAKPAPKATAKPATDEPTPAETTTVDTAEILARPPMLIPADAETPEGHVVLPLPRSMPGTLKRVMPIEEYQVRLAHLRAPFAPDQIEKLPRPLSKGDTNKGRCDGTDAWYSADDYYCGGWHARSIHLDYIGHAGITMRLLEVDPLYFLDTIGHDDFGQPMWHANGTHATLTILGMTRPGFGDASDKFGANAIKEVIGDALRNIAMRFGVGTYLWSKSDAAAALKTEQEPPALAADEFWRAVATASLAPNPEQALIAYGKQVTREVLSSVTVTLPDGSTCTAAHALEGAIGNVRARAAVHANAAPTAQEQGAHADEAAHAHPDDAHAPDAHPDGDAHAQTAPAEEEGAARATPDHAHGDPAPTAPDAPAVPAQSPGAPFAFTLAPDGEEPRQHKQPRLLWDELRFHAHVHQVPEETYMASLLDGQGVTRESRASQLQKAVQAGRPAVIEALRAQMRSTEAELLEAQGNAAPINLEGLLNQAAARN